MSDGKVICADAKYKKCAKANTCPCAVPHSHNLCCDEFACEMGDDKFCVPVVKPEQGEEKKTWKS